MQALKITDHATAVSFSKEHGEMPFNDNGGEPDGSAWVLPLDEIPERMMGDLDKFGEIVEAEQKKYDPTWKDTGSFAEPWPNRAWTGWTFDGHAIIEKKERLASKPGEKGWGSTKPLVEQLSRQ